jgi:hypothetical protein
MAEETATAGRAVGLAAIELLEIALGGAVLAGTRLAALARRLPAGPLEDLAPEAAAFARRLCDLGLSPTGADRAAPAPASRRPRR